MTIDTGLARTGPFDLGAEAYSGQSESERRGALGPNRALVQVKLPDKYCRYPAGALKNLEACGSGC